MASTRCYDKPEFLYQEVSSKDSNFDVKKDIFEGRTMDVDDIMATKAIGNVTMIEDINVGGEAMMNPMKLQR